MTNGFSEGQDALIEKAVRHTVDYLIDRKAIATPADIAEHAKNCPGANPNKPTFWGGVKKQAPASITAAITLGLLYCLWEGFRFFVSKGG